MTYWPPSCNSRKAKVVKIFNFWLSINFMPSAYCKCDHMLNKLYVKRVLTHGKAWFEDMSEVSKEFLGLHHQECQQLPFGK